MQWWWIAQYREAQYSMLIHFSYQSKIKGRASRAAHQSISTFCYQSKIYTKFRRSSGRTCYHPIQNIHLDRAAYMDICIYIYIHVCDMWCITNRVWRHFDVLWLRANTSHASDPGLRWAIHNRRKVRTLIHNSFNPKYTHMLHTYRAKVTKGGCMYAMMMNSTIPRGTVQYAYTF